MDVGEPTVVVVVAAGATETGETAVGTAEMTDVAAGVAVTTDTGVTPAGPGWAATRTERRSPC